MIKEAILYSKLSNNRVQCGICSHRCVIHQGRRGICGVRENKNGVLYSLVYKTLIADNVDPIEKKPFYHFLPGSFSYSIATVGCNFRCDFCQNSQISQMPRSTLMIMGEDTEPATIVRRAKANSCQTISYTYTEPTVYLETVLETAKFASQEGLKNILVTNGFMTAEALELIAPFISAANVDLKSFREDYYKKLCGGRLQPVLDSLKKMKQMGIWLEITTLLVPGLNDSDEELKEITAFIAALGLEIPWHISRFHPQFKMPDRAVTPVEALHRARRFGLDAGLRYVYSGNAPGDEGENTCCPNCGNPLLERRGFTIIRNNLQDAACARCGKKLEGIF